MYGTVLIHHGIKGQKWGVRRYQNEDGSLTSAGEKRYDVGDGNDKIRRKLDSEAESEKKKSKHRLKLEEKYKTKGMTDEEASIAAYKQVRTEKIVATVGALTLTAAAATITAKNWDKIVDPKLKSGAVLKRVTSDSNYTLHDVAYAAKNKTDANKYVGLWAKQQADAGRTMYQKKIIVGDQGLKIANERHARREAAKLMADNRDFQAKFMRALNDQAGSGNSAQNKVVRNALQDVKKGKMSKDAYRALNLMATAKQGDAKDINLQLMSALKRKGYGAMIDVNDKYLSGYKAKTPYILFDKSKVTVKDVAQLSKATMEKMHATEVHKELMKQSVTGLAVQYAPIIVGGATAIGIGTYNRTLGRNNANIKAVEQYRKEHPTTTKSYSEILKSLGRTL